MRVFFQPTIREMSQMSAICPRGVYERHPQYPQTPARLQWRRCQFQQHIEMPVCATKSKVASGSRDRRKTRCAHRQGIPGRGRFLADGLSGGHLPRGLSGRLSSATSLNRSPPVGGEVRHNHLYSHEFRSRSHMFILTAVFAHLRAQGGGRVVT
jgi:hypothetical protein